MRKLLGLILLPMTLYSQFMDSHDDWSNVDNDISSDNPFDFGSIVGYLFAAFLIYGYISDKRKNSK